MRVVLHSARYASSVAGERYGQLDIEIFERVQAVTAFHGLHSCKGHVLGRWQRSWLGGSSEHGKQLHQHFDERLPRIFV
jgi:hypothetical protein